MDCEYELFERLPDGVLNWRGVVQGLLMAKVWARLLVIETEHECFAKQVGGKEIEVLSVPAG